MKIFDQTVFVIILTILLFLSVRTVFAEELHFEWDYDSSSIPAEITGGFVAYQHGAEACRWVGLNQREGDCTVDPFGSVTDWTLKTFVNVQGVEQFSSSSSVKVFIKGIITWNVEIVETNI